MAKHKPMNFIIPNITDVFIESQDSMFIDFERKNLPINLDLVINLDKADVTTSGISIEIPSIKFTTVKDTVFWFFESEDDRDKEFKRLEKKLFKNRLQL